MSDPSGTIKPVLEVEHLSVEFARPHQEPVPVVRDVGFSIDPGEIVALVGESGSGKTVTSLSILGLLANNGRVRSGRVILADQNLLDLPKRGLRRIRGDRISMVLQDALTSLNPVHQIGKQIAEVLRLHRGLSRRAANNRAVALLESVGIPDADQRAQEYPHQLSGGMRQRVMIAMALACKPALLIADEPTTALDVTVEAQVLQLIVRLCREEGTAVLLVTHNLGIVADVADRVLVMYGGEIVEAGPVAEVLENPLHPYAQGLLDSQPERAVRGQPLRIIPGQVPHPLSLGKGCPFASRCAFAVAECRAVNPPLVAVGPDTGRSVACPVAIPPWEPARPMEVWRDTVARPTGAKTTPLLEVTSLSKEFHRPGGALLGHHAALRAVADVSFSIAPGESLGLVGESGCGKSTTARLIARLVEPTSGSIVLDGTDITHLGGEELRQLRQQIQVVFQDPFGSLNPRHSVRKTIGDPLTSYDRPSRAVRNERVGELLDLVGLAPDFADRAPHQLSGGQRQRVAIARALALQPRLLVCDEPVASLDVSIQAQVLNVLSDLQRRMGLSYLFISHDLGVVRYISDRIAVMYLGRIVEIGAADTVFNDPRHPYTEALIASTPGRRTLGDGAAAVGEPLLAQASGSGCPYASRCPFAQPICSESRPELVELSNGTHAACHFASDIPGRVVVPTPTRVHTRVPADVG
jgi:peptide/nickel transport system ATP-binding protein